MLSAKELHEIRTSKNEPRPLPSLGKKDFFPTCSPEEKSNIDAMIQERMSCMSEERVVKKNTLSTANWLPNVGLAEVTHLLGNGWESFGFTEKISGKLRLYPEEALFLLETAGVELRYAGTAVSIQHAYSLLLKEKCCSLEKYRVYSHLRRQGHRILRSTQVPSGKRTSDQSCSGPSKKPKIDSITNYSTAKNISSKSNEVQTLLFQRPASDSLDRNVIPDFGCNSSISIVFGDTKLLPESCWNRRSSYTFLKKDFFHSDSELMKSDSGYSEPSDNVLFRGKTQPLIYRMDSMKSGSIYSRLKIFSKASTVPEDNETLHISFHIYPPGSHFRKSDPGVAAYSIVVTTWDQKFPSSAALEHLKKQMHPQTLLMIAVVGQGSDISYYQLDTGSTALITEDPNEVTNN